MRSDEVISKALNISISTIERVRRRFVIEGIDSALNYRPGRGRKQKRLDGEGEAHLLAIARRAVRGARSLVVKHLKGEKDGL